MLASFEAIQLVKCTDADAEMLATFGRKTFYEAFAAHNTTQNMEQYLDHAFSAEKINIELETIQQPETVPAQSATQEA